MEYVVGAILLVIVIIIVGLVLRNKIYSYIDRLEAWKVDIMNRNIAAELSRMKELNLTGETEKNFDAWRKRWEDIVTDELADVEIKLFDAEAASDQYKLPTAKTILEETENKLNQIEIELETILRELHNLLEIEEASRKEIEAIKPRLKVVVEQLNNPKLDFGHAQKRFEQLGESISAKLETYDELVESGEYHEAKEEVDSIVETLSKLEKEVQVFPEIYEVISKELPLELDEIQAGIKEMEVDGYPVEHLDLNEAIKKNRELLKETVRKFETEGKGEPEELINKVKEEIEQYYQVLEEEVKAKAYLDKETPKFESRLADFILVSSDTQAELELLKESYYFNDEDLNEVINLDKRIVDLQERYAHLVEARENKTAKLTDLKQQLENNLNDFEQLVLDHDAYKEKVDALRKDEIEIKDKLEDLIHKLEKAIRTIKFTNLPGVPDFIYDQVEVAHHNYESAKKELDNQPLDIPTLKQRLQETETSVKAAVEQIELMNEQAKLTEIIIQYANRYRSQSQDMALELDEAEKLFRQTNYELALEKAATALEAIEPGALKKIEKNQQYFL